MSRSYGLVDHEGTRVKHGKEDVNGIRLHYGISGSGPRHMSSSSVANRP